MQMTRRIERVETADEVFSVGSEYACQIGGGSRTVKEIGVNYPKFPGDVMFYDVLFSDTSIIRIHAPAIVYLSKEVPVIEKATEIIPPLKL